MCRPRSLFCDTRDGPERQVKSNLSRPLLITVVRLTMSLWPDRGSQTINHCEILTVASNRVNQCGDGFGFVKVCRSGIIAYYLPVERFLVCMSLCE